MKGLLAWYEKMKEKIREREEDFRRVWNSSDEEIFSELVFCICTPQSSARKCDAAVKNLIEIGLLFNGNAKDIESCLRGVRFPSNKARYIVMAREMFTVNGKIRIKEFIYPEDPRRTREWLVKNVKGLGYKEASHFLRNIGLGKEFAILDRHILKNLCRYGVIEEIPKSMSRKAYLEIERRMKAFSERIGIPMGELDMLFWSMETGEVFK